jgi:hypothetical protein
VAKLKLPANVSSATPKQTDLREFSSFAGVTDTRQRRDVLRALRKGEGCRVMATWNDEVLIDDARASERRVCVRV